MRFLRLKLLGAIIIISMSSLFSLRGVNANSNTLSGSVTNSSGAPVVGAVVSVNDANSDSATTDSSGNYSLSIPDGTYNVQVTPPSSSSFSSAVAYGEVVSVNTTLNYVLTQAGTASLSGHVYDAEGNPVSGQTILAVAGSTQVSATTNSSGYYSLSTSPGTYSLIIYGTTSADVGQNLPAEYSLESDGYSLAEDTIQNITIPAKQVTFHAQDSSNNPVSNVEITTTDTGLGTLSLGGGLTSSGDSTIPCG